MHEKFVCVFLCVRVSSRVSFCVGEKSVCVCELLHHNWHWPCVAVLLILEICCGQDKFVVVVPKFV